MCVYVLVCSHPRRLPVAVTRRPDVRSAVGVAGGAGAGRRVPLNRLRGRGGVRRGLRPG